jgi:DNA polymerase I-like protein with 3'-5' exonuclease and polymerase domains
MKQTFVPTWHPAALFQDKNKCMRSFLIHIDTIVRVTQGKRPATPPKIIFNPTKMQAYEFFHYAKGVFALDIETISTTDTRILTIAVARKRRALVWSLQDPRVKKRLQYLQEGILNATRVVMQNADFDVGGLRDNGWEIRDEVIWDTMLEHQIYFPDEPVNLSFLSSLANDVPAWKHLRSSDPAKLMEYNAWDAWQTDVVYETPQDPDLVTSAMRSYVEYRMPTLWKSIMKLNRAGVKLDQMAQRQLKTEHKKRAKSWKARIIKHCKDLGSDPPLGWKGGKKAGDWTENVSNKRAKELLYDSLKLPRMKHPETGSVTINAEALEKLENLDDTGTVTLLLERSYLKDTETPSKVKPDKDGLVRSRFVFGGDEKHDEKELGKESPSSGRLASREPNLQNIREWVRFIYISRFRNGWLLKADYSQIELRLIGYFSGDSKLIKAVETDAHLYLMYLVDQATDLHGLAKHGFQWLLDNMDDPKVKRARKEQKSINFGWPYRMGAKKIENKYGVPYKRAKGALDGLNRQFYRVVDWWDSLEREVKRTAKGTGWGYLTNPFGRIRRFYPEDLPAMCAFKPSSTAADILYDAMDKMHDRLGKLGIPCLSIHDEVVVDTRHPEQCAELVRSCMEVPVKQLDEMVIPVDIKVGRNWAEASSDNPEGVRPLKEWKKRESRRARSRNRTNSR